MHTGMLRKAYTIRYAVMESTLNRAYGPCLLFLLDFNNIKDWDAKLSTVIDWLEKDPEMKKKWTEHLHQMQDDEIEVRLCVIYFEFLNLYLREIFYL